MNLVLCILVEALNAIVSSNFESILLVPEAFSTHHLTEVTASWA